MTTTAPATTPAPKRRTGRALFAGAAAIALLSAGGGSFALWQDSATVSSGTQITSGNLDVEAEAAGAWKFANGSNKDAPITAASRIVPGDVLEFTQDVTVYASGDNLEATLTADLSKLGLATSEGASNADLVEALDAKLWVGDVEGANFTTDITSDENGDTLPVKVQITFDPTTGGQGAQKDSIQLVNLPITLTQNN